MIRQTPLSSFATVVGRGIAPRYAETGDVTVFNQKCVRNGVVNISAARRHDAEGRSVPASKVLRPGDLLVNSTGQGTLGRTGLFTGLAASATVDSHITIVRPKPGTHARWLSYALRMLEPRIEDLAQGSTGQTELPRESLASLPVPSVRSAEQQAIAEVLGALDDKIAANTTLAATADELMLRTFRHSPRDRTGPLSSTASFVNGRAFTKGASGTGRVVVRIAELNGGVSGSTVFSDAIVDDTHVARPGDILFAWSGSLTLRRWFLDEAIVNQHIFKVIPNADMPTWLVFELIREKLDDFKAIAADKATTMGHIQRHHLDQAVGLPDAEQIASLDPLMSGLWSAALNAERESMTLAATRDALLPQLMSGKLRVRDAEKIAAEAGA